ncbi:type II toxin-antitoxin system RelE/ParE family toxin [Lentilactobacillus otakiensis]|uniref:Toxin-antitoxin system, toxin component, RelE family n=1 Tax=Lentilactobacillus otakiensis DSM 19908 = JCM 15040 TaxID=1423780 RepID=S4NTK9_9LACO|nr:type II toxin-antitoxin system RelE/ParE family toxin [Lentilactobacillus otakiensis]KRL10978.1 hypothetical protein FD05_GL000131 [Lentilactobacillus otakiensis DSM 19908 = JCM 15040]MBZ3777212.1 type II toxin-antitoxin system RelE/ParE family toxin [Lentilactobacillus otakiensis]MDV3517809.1 type II toxin-antitoxin system RelE/ParE family toxin [Lentilactobacillus otakiensis]GAD17318.1 hypothetical protein LOT_1856 [Lentilactobacillus otakiensis DSM 19908 = JCM 15040]
MEKITFEAYIRPNGHNEFREFLSSLPDKDARKVLYTLDAISEVGILDAAKMKWVKRLNDDLFEVRSKLGTNIQRVIYFHVVAGRYVITHGFTKKSQKTPITQIQHGEKIRQEFLQELREGK